VAVYRASAACGGFGFARNTATTFDRACSIASSRNSCSANFAIQDLNALGRINNLSKRVPFDMASLKGNACRLTTEHHGCCGC
jgi:hypothetical protein